MISAGVMLALLALPGARPAYALEALVDLCNHLSVPLPLRSVVVNGSWNLRAGPGKETVVAGDLAQGELVEVWGQFVNAQGETWLMVCSADCQRAGWLMAAALDT